MTITLYRSSADPAELNKTNMLVEVLSLEGTLRGICSIINPQIEVQHLDFLNVNYAYIAEFGRYYFITEIVSIRKDIWQLNMHVDVLMSFKSEILNLTAFIDRANVDDYQSRPLYDRDLPVSCDAIFKRFIDFENRKYSIFDPRLNFPGTNSYLFCITIAYNHYPSGTVGYEPEYDSPNFILSQESTSVINLYYDSVDDYITDLNQFTIAQLKDVILRVCCIPFADRNIWDSLDPHVLESIKIGDKTYTLHGCSVFSNGLNISNEYTNVVINSIIDLDVSSIFDPQTILELHLPFYGNVEVPKSALFFINNNWTVDIKINTIFDIATGDIQYNILITDTNYTEKTYKLFKSVSFQLLESQPFAYSNRDVVEARRIANQLTLAGNLTSDLTTGIGTLGHNLTKRNSNPIDTNGGVLESLGSAAQHIFSYFANEATNLEMVGSTRGNSNYLSFSDSREFFIQITYHPIMVDRTLYNERHGALYRDFGVINNFSGYLQIGDVHVENVSNAVLSELSEIERKLVYGIKV